MFGLLVYESYNLNNVVAKTNCILAVIPRDLMLGVNAESDQFLGLNNIVDLLNVFKEESPAISEKLGINFLNIAESSLDSKTSKIFSLVRNFASQYKGSGDETRRPWTPPNATSSR